MRVAIIPEDGTVVKDGVAYTGLNLSGLPSNVHAVQWDTTGGEVEAETGENTPIDSLAPYQAALDAWEAAHAEATAPEPPEPEPTLEEKRESATLTRMEFMLALDNLGLYDAAEAKVNDQTLPRRIRLRWANALEFRRNDADLNNLAAQLGISPTQMDGVFGL